MAYEDDLMEALDGEEFGGFGAYLEHPGWINLVHAGSEGVTVAATPLYEGYDAINVQITDNEGREIKSFDIPFEVTENIKTDVRNYKEKIEQYKSQILSAVQEHRKSLTASASSILPAIQTLVEEYIEENWTTAKKGWKEEAVQNVRLVKQDANEYVVETAWRQDPVEYKNPGGTATIVITVQEKE